MKTPGKRPTNRGPATRAGGISAPPDLRQKVLPKSPSGAAMRYALNRWEGLTPGASSREQVAKGAALSW